MPNKQVGNKQVDHDGEVQVKVTEEIREEKTKLCLQPGPGGRAPRAVEGWGTPHGTRTSSGRAGGVLGVLRSYSPEKPGGEGTDLLWGAGQNYSEYRWGLCANGKGESLLKDPQPCPGPVGYVGCVNLCCSL